MRALILLAGALALSSCGRSGTSEATQNVNDNLTAESIVSNDVTAIDAVTGDAANMAADVDMNYGNLAENGPAPLSNMPVTSTRKPAARPASPAAAATNAPSNAASNAE